MNVPISALYAPDAPWNEEEEPTVEVVVKEHFGRTFEAPEIEGAEAYECLQYVHDTPMNVLLDEVKKYLLAQKDRRAKELADELSQWMQYDRDVEFV